MSMKPSSANGSTGSSSGTLDLSALARELPLETLRMVDLARAVARDPHVLLLDEITAALSADQAERVFALLRRWKERGRSAVLITHRLAEVMRVCDRATILRDGENVAQIAMADVNEHQLVEAMLGAPVEAIAQDADGVAREYGVVSFEARALSSKETVQDISFSVRTGEILGIVALEGQGQDRLFELLSGDRGPSSGEILVSGEACRFHSPHDAVRKGVVLVPGDRLLALLPDLSVHQNLAHAALQPHAALAGHPLGRTGTGRRRHRPALHRHPGRVTGAASLRRQPAEGGRGPLACGRFPHAALL